MTSCQHFEVAHRLKDLDNVRMKRVQRSGKTKSIRISVFAEEGAE